MENTPKKKKRINIEHKQIRENHRLMKSLMKNNITTPTDQRAWKVIWLLPVNAETHSGGNGVHSGEEVRSSEGRTEGSGLKRNA